MIKKIAFIMLLLLLMVVVAIILLPRVPVDSGPENSLQNFFSAYQKQIEVIKSKREAGHLVISDNKGTVITDIVNDSVKQYGIPARFRGKTGESVELEIAGVDKKQLLRWLAVLRVDHELYISSIKVLKSEQPNRVTVPLLVLVKASVPSPIQ